MITAPIPRPNPDFPNPKAELIHWLSLREFSHFITVTYREPRNPSQFFVEAQRVENCLPGTMGFLAGEEHKTGYLHLHGLIRPRGMYDSKDEVAGRWFSEEAWQRLYKRFGRSQVDPINSIGGVIGYCTKYCGKHLTDYWWLW